VTLLEKIRHTLLEDKGVWNLAVYIQEAPFSIDFDLKDPQELLRCRRLKLFGPYPHTCADPFLFSKDDSLYIFYEKVFPHRHGTINALVTKDLCSYHDMGEILREPYHLSFPYVFQDLNGNIFMMPESSRFGVLSLYSFREFPRNVVKARDLLVGNFYDSSVILERERWYLFTTSPEGLHIFLTDDLRGGELRAHPLNPVSTDPRYCRCGGAPFRVGERLFRVAQDCSESYGRNIHLFEIVEISENRYQEILVRENAIDLQPDWCRLGSHHLSVTTFLGKTVICVDGKEPDVYANRFFSLFSRRYKK